MKNKQLVIIGGGSSLRLPIQDGLWKKLEGCYTIGINYNYRHFESTCLMGVDDAFYTKEPIKNLPLLVWGFKKKLNFFKIHPNTIPIRTKGTYSGRDLSTGVYCSRLSGMFALTLGINLVDVGEIFTLGFDFGCNFKTVINKQYATHYYQDEFKHRGSGHIGYYSIRSRMANDFAVYKDEKKVKIYNVIDVPESHISTFEKINYDTFYSKLNKETLNQELLRKSIRQKLENINANWNL